MTRILALDAAGTTGVAWGEAGAEPRFATRQFAGNVAPGAVLAKFRCWLLATIERVQPSDVVYESPYMPSGWAGTRNVRTVRRLMALCETIDAVCWEKKIPCYEVGTSEVCLFFTGQGSWGGRDKKKAATVARARLYGWNVANDDEADACAIWCAAENRLAPALAQQRRARLGLELNLPPPTENAPRRRTAGRVGVGSTTRRKGISSNGKRRKNTSEPSQFQFTAG